MQTLTLGFSPCPNDTFIFDALVNNKIIVGDWQFNVVLEDVQTLNQWALEGKLDITKLSYGVLPRVLDEYCLLKSGSALGTGVGPLLISKPEQENQAVEATTIAIPGENTTAHLLFSMAYPDAKNKLFMRYDAIEDFVMAGKGLGVIIHENRFTYEAKGLKKIVDLGDFWEKKMNTAIPLGGIVMKRKFPTAMITAVENEIRESIRYAFSNYPQLNDYIRMHAQEMSEDVMRKHIDLYVNDYSLDLGKTGITAIEELVSIYRQTNHINTPMRNLFVE